MSSKLFFEICFVSFLGYDFLFKSLLGHCVSCSFENSDFSISVDNDISLIKLKEPVSCNKAIQVACITTNEPFEDDQCTVSGWGTDSNGKHPKTLMKANVPIVLKSQCNEWYSGYVTENMVCAGFENKGSCIGDGGGKYVLKEHLGYSQLDNYHAKSSFNTLGGSFMTNTQT